MHVPLKFFIWKFWDICFIYLYFNFIYLHFSHCVCVCEYKHQRIHKSVFFFYHVCPGDRRIVRSNGRYTYPLSQFHATLCLLFTYLFLFELLDEHLKAFQVGGLRKYCCYQHFNCKIIAETLFKKVVQSYYHLLYT